MSAPQIMGIVNVTPDSFSDGGKFLNVDAAVAHALSLASQGASIVDIGGESTRPGAENVSESDEIERVVPVIKLLKDELRSSETRISIDTRKESVARAALESGAQILNDVSASLDEIANEFNVPWVAMHMRGTPENMQDNPSFKNVVREVQDELLAKIEPALNRGQDVWIDPGIGFGKTFDNNIDLLANIATFVEAGLPVVIGASRKSFMREITGEKQAEQRLDASLSVALWCANQGVQVLRVHDVAETVNALKTWNTIEDHKQ